MGLENKAAFVSGAGRNIGRAIALELAGHGCNVIVNGLTGRDACEETASAVRAKGVKAVVCVGDIGDSTAVKAMAAQAFAAFGIVDIVVNNAAIRPHQPFLEMSEADYHRVLAIDLHAAVYTSRAFLPGMIGRKWGRLVNIPGMNAMRGHATRAPVAVAKHGLWGLTKSLAKEFGPDGITVNAISPGTIRGSKDSAPRSAAQMAETLRRIPLGHPGTPEDIAALTGFLCSDEGGFVSGQMIGSNGAAET